MFFTQLAALHRTFFCPYFEIELLVFVLPIPAEKQRESNCYKHFVPGLTINISIIISLKRYFLLASATRIYNMVQQHNYIVSPADILEDLRVAQLVLKTLMNFSMWTPRCHANLMRPLLHSSLWPQYYVKLSFPLFLHNQWPTWSTIQICKTAYCAF